MATSGFPDLRVFAPSTPSHALIAHSGLRAEGLSAYSGGTVMALHHLPLTLSPSLPGTLS